LRSMRRSLGRGRAEAEEPTITLQGRGIVASLTAEWRRVLGTRAAFGLVVLAPVLRDAFYPRPYLTQILRDIPIAVVDNDLNDLSRQIVDTLDASGTVKVRVRTDRLEEARRSLDQRKVFAIVGIAPDTQRNVLKGNSVPVPVYIDATYLFLYRSA